MVPKAQPETMPAGSYTYISFLYYVVVLVSLSCRLVCRPSLFLFGIRRNYTMLIRLAFVSLFVSIFRPSILAYRAPSLLVLPRAPPVLTFGVYSLRIARASILTPHG